MGYKDILYAVAITLQKLDQVVSLKQEEIDLKIIIDCQEMAKKVVQKSFIEKTTLPTFIEIDVDAHRAGVSLEDQDNLVQIGHIF